MPSPATVPSQDLSSKDPEEHAHAMRSKFPGECPDCGSQEGQPCVVEGSANPDRVHSKRAQQQTQRPSR